MRMALMENPESTNAVHRAGLIWTNILGGILFALVAGCATEARPAQLDAGEKALAAQQYDVALRNADSVLSMDAPASQAEARYLRGLVIEDRPKANPMSAQHDLDAARGEYSLALSQTPTMPVEARIHAQLGNVAYFSEDYSTALREWTLADAQLDMPMWKAWILYRMGICQQRLGRFTDADQTFSRVQQLYPNTEPATRAHSREGAHGFYVQLGAFAQAADAQRAAAAILALGSVPMKTMQGNLTIIQTKGMPTFSQASALRARLVGSYPDAKIMP
ncbi:MAG: SPOR domain-containing protein [Planctomycetota bacterium]|nr:SPOR domain-containing protein [Planctomycetota bacterium]